jgi:hypothetical protein
MQLTTSPLTPKSCLSKTPQSIDTSLRNQAQEMEHKLDQATKEMKRDIGSMEDNITNKLQIAIKDTILQLVPDVSEQKKELNSKIIEGTRTADKLNGDIKIATATVQLNNNISTKWKSEGFVKINGFVI